MMLWPEKVFQVKVEGHHFQRHLGQKSEKRLLKIVNISVLRIRRGFRS